MGALLAVLVLAALIVPVGLLRLPELIPGAMPEPVPPRDEEPGGIFTEAMIRRRLDALADELERLERDREVFAKAFHTNVARTAYETLLVDAAELTEQRRAVVAGAVEFELLEPSTGGHVEEIEL